MYETDLCSYLVISCFCFLEGSGSVSEFSSMEINHIRVATPVCLLVRVS